MKGIGNTKAQLTDEVRSLRQKIAELEARVTMGKQAEGKLKESEEGYRKLIEISPDAIFVHIDQKIVFMNPAGLELLGAHNSSEVIGKSILDFTHPDYLEVIKRRQELLKKGEAPRHEYFKAIRLDGSVIDVETTSAQVTYQGKSAILSTIRDVTDRVKAEELIEKSRTQYRDIVNNSVLGMAVYVPGQPLVFTNKRMTEITGYSVEEIESPDFNFMVLFTEEDQRLITANIKRRFTGEYIPPYESMLISKTGDRKWVLIYNINTEYEGESAIQVQLLDISERKQAEEMLWESEQNFRNSLDSSPLGIRIVTTDGELLYANQAILDIYDYSSVEELKAMPTKQRYTPESYAEHQERKERRKLGKPIPAHYEISIVRKNGEIRHLVASRKEVTWGGETQYQTIYQDVTERKRAEETLRESEEKLQRMFEFATDGIMVTDLNGNIMELNEAAIRLRGSDSKEKLIGRSTFELIAEKDRVRVMEILKSALEDGQIRKDVELTFLTEDGREYLAEVSSALLRDTAGNPTGFIAIFRDVTEHKQAEEELKKHREHLEKLVDQRTAELQQEITERKRAQEEIEAQKKFTDNVIDSLPDTFYIFDAESGKGIQWNKTLNEISGYNYEEMNELPPLHFYPPEEHQLVEEVIKTTLEKGRATAELNYIIADGTRIPFEYSTVLIKDAEGKPCICAIGRDITERKRAEEDMRKYAEQLKQANIRLQEMDRLKSVFLASMSHELRTPLNSIIGYTGLILMGVVGEISEEQREQLSVVKKNANHLLSLINDVLDISKIEAGKVELSPKEFSLNDVVREVVETLSPAASEKGLELLTEVPEDITLLSDTRRVKQVLVNLVGNAVKFTDQGSVRIAARVLRDENLEVRVIDTGIGIKKEDMYKLFQPFQQMGVSLAMRHKGTGLGLYLTKKLVTILGGDISAKSEYGTGSEFTFILPLEYREEQK